MNYRLHHLFTRGDVWIEHHTSQATLGSDPYRNPNLFFGYYFDDVADDLENYLQTKERAEEHDAKIEETNQLISCQLFCR